MSRATFAIVAAVSAATGAGITAFFYSGSSRQLALTTPPALSPTNDFSKIPTLQIPIPPLAAKFADSPVDPAGVLQYGFPGPVVDNLESLPLIGAFDRRTRNPIWVAEHITPYSVSRNDGNRKGSSFFEDTNIPSMFRAKLSDYFRSGYDRGHQVPAGDAKWSQDAMDATFALSNMCPQVGEGFNRDYWAHFEEFGRSLTKQYPSVRIVTGPLYLPKRDSDGKYHVSYEVIGDPPNVSVPTHFYKVIFAEHGTSPTDKVALGAFVLPNARISNHQSLSDFEVPVEVLERASGLEFATKLDSSRRRQLCQEVKCEIVMRRFKDTNRKVSPPPGGQ